MAFTLTQISTGEQKDFNIREILELLGDPINDEIRIRGQIYRIGDVQGDLTGGGNGGSVRADWKKYALAVTQTGQNSFDVNLNTDDPEGLFLVVNGALYDYGTDGAFHIEGTRLYWHGRFTLELTDIIYLKYLTLSI
jgi:hypothetical protein